MTDVPGFPAWEAALRDGSFEDAQSALEAVVGLLEAGNLPLDRSVACYELGMRLADRCEKMLAEAELTVTMLDAGSPREAGGFDPFDSSDDPADDAPF